MSGRRGAILIVDDATDSLGMLDEMLRGQGYQTFLANSGARALDLAQRVQPDLILLDVMMPGMDGFETCRRLKAHPETSGIPVIFVSACGETDDVVAGFDHGAVDYIYKPVRLAEVNARVRAHLQLRSSTEEQQRQARRLRMIIEGMDEGLMLLGPDGNIQYANPASERCLGFSVTELTGRPLAGLLAEPAASDYAAYFRQSDEVAAARCRGTREVSLARRDGSMRAMDLSLTPMAAGESLFVAVLHDITHHKQSEDALQRAALVDSLTGIANRRHFDVFLDREWQRATRSGLPLSLVVLDVDHFKAYNDILGHDAGDECLRAVAARVQAGALRPTDLAARYGGEEFVLLLAETPHEGAAHLAETIRVAVEEMAAPNPGAVGRNHVTVSVGVATMVPTQFDDIRSLFVAADRAMYEAKAAGRNRTVSVRAGTAWETMRAALAG